MSARNLKTIRNFILIYNLSEVVFVHVQAQITLY